jgi:FkbM family methyltransferase
VPGTFWVPRVLGEKGLAEYEPEALSVFLALLQGAGRRAVFFDVGSNVGPFCLVAAALSRAHVVAFEPAPSTAAVLRTIQQDNRLAISVEQMALGEKEGESQLYLSMQTDASNSLQADFREWEETVTVRVETLDGYCMRTGLTPSLMKIDTEATEPAVLRGAHRLLEEVKPPIICEVLPGRTEHDLEEIFGRYGYLFYAIGESGTLEHRTRIEGDDAYRFRDWLFVPEPIKPEFARAVRGWNGALTKL